jgi:molybdate transport system substrate-binding protein
VDAGLVYQTDAFINPDVRILALAEPEWHRPLVYPIAVVKDSHAPDMARQFVSFAVGETGQIIMERYGFRRGTD